MTTIFRKHIARKDIRAHPDRLDGFGDNHLERKGYGGQACKCCGEPNAIGIPTKRAPSMKENAFFSDADYEFWRIAIHEAMRACDEEEVRAIALHPECKCFGGGAAAAREFAISIFTGWGCRAARRNSGHGHPWRALPGDRIRIRELCPDLIDPGLADLSLPTPLCYPIAAWASKAFGNAVGLWKTRNRVGHDGREVDVSMS